MNYETVWGFNTDRFRVVLSVAPEQDGPADYFEDINNVEFAQEGGWHWFVARVTVDVLLDGEWTTIGRDYLGGCSYHNLQDFLRDGYFRDMVREAVREARVTIANVVGIRLRSNSTHALGAHVL